MKNNLLNIFIKERLDDQLIRLFNTPHIGAIAQSVEQRIENPCVGSSILPRATIRLLDSKTPNIEKCLGFFYG